MALRDRLTTVRRTVRRTVLARRRLLAGLLTAVAVAAGLNAATAEPPPSVAVLVAAHDLPAGAVIGARDVRRVGFAPDSVPEGLAREPTGRTLAAPLRAGEPLTDVRRVGFTPDSVPEGLALEPTGRTLAAPLRAGEPLTDVRLVGPALVDGYPGLVAVPVRLPDAGMAGLLRVGDRIDLVSADPQGRAAETIAAGVPVLALPDTPTEVGAAGLAGRLVVVGAEAHEVARIADASVRTFVTIAFAG